MSTRRRRSEKTTTDEVQPTVEKRQRSNAKKNVVERDNDDSKAADDDDQDVCIGDIKPKDLHPHHTTATTISGRELDGVDDTERIEKDLNDPTHDNPLIMTATQREHDITAQKTTTPDVIDTNISPSKDRDDELTLGAQTKSDDVLHVKTGDDISKTSNEITDTVAPTHTHVVGTTKPQSTQDHNHNKHSNDDTNFVSQKTNNVGVGDDTTTQQACPVDCTTSHGHHQACPDDCIDTHHKSSSLLSSSSSSQKQSN